MNWRKMSLEKPADGRQCLTKMKHGIIEGYYNAREGTFHGYYWQDIEWFALEWVPIEEVE